jgi:hypothetical protein
MYWKAHFCPQGVIRRKVPLEVEIHESGLSKTLPELMNPVTIELPS